MLREVSKRHSYYSDIVVKECSLVNVVSGIPKEGDLRDMAGS